MSHSALESFKIPPDGLGSEIVEATFNNETLQFNRQNGEHGKVKKNGLIIMPFTNQKWGGCISQTINGGAATHPWKCIVVLFDQPAALLFVQSVTLPIAAAFILKIQPLVGNLKPFEV